MAKKTIEVDAIIGDTINGKRVKAISIDENGEARYKTDDKHTLVLVGEDTRQATFQCSYCQRSIAFALPGLGKPAAVGSTGAWQPPADFMTWMDPCRIDA